MVAALLVVVREAADGPVGDLAGDLLDGRHGTGFVDLLVVAVVAAVYANVLDNLPAVLLMAGVLEGAPTDTLLAAVVGASVGCTVLPHGSLATLLWQRLLVGARRPAPVGPFVGTGLVITPLVVVVAVAGLRLAS